MLSTNFYQVKIIATTKTSGEILNDDEKLY